MNDFPDRVLILASIVSYTTYDEVVLLALLLPLGGALPRESLQGSPPPPVLNLRRDDGRNCRDPGHLGNAVGRIAGTCYAGWKHSTLNFGSPHSSSRPCRAVSRRGGNGTCMRLSPPNGARMGHVHMVRRGPVLDCFQSRPTALTHLPPRSRWRWLLGVHAARGISARGSPLSPPPAPITQPLFNGRVAK